MLGNDWIDDMRITPEKESASAQPRGLIRVMDRREVSKKKPIVTLRRDNTREREVAIGYDSGV
jgi:hypothetical protein